MYLLFLLLYILLGKDPRSLEIIILLLTLCFKDWEYSRELDRLDDFILQQNLQMVKLTERIRDLERKG